jgi:hypothetical protein
MTEIKNRSQKVRQSMWPCANQQGCAVILFAQAVEQREAVQLERRTVTESSDVQESSYQLSSPSA